MNRTVLYGGIGAVVVLLGGAAWLLVGDRLVGSSSNLANIEDQGPITLNQVDVITEHGANESPDGRTLTISFPKFELNAKSGETKSAVFSTTWRLKLAADERALVAVASVGGSMQSAAPAPAPAPEATPEPAPAATPAPADAATPAPEQPAATPPAPAAPPAPPKPVAGNGVARVIVTIGTETTVSEWIDITGEGADRKLSKAVSFVGASGMRTGSTVPVTVMVELSGGTTGDATATISAIDLKLFAESVPLPTAEPAPAATPVTTDAAPADTATAPATPPADAGTTPAPATTPTP